MTKIAENRYTQSTICYPEGYDLLPARVNWLLLKDTYIKPLAHTLETNYICKKSSIPVIR